MSNRLALFASVVSLAATLAGCIVADDTEDEPVAESEEALASSDRAPGTVRGVKLKHPGGDDDVRNTCLYMTGSKERGYRGLAGELGKNGIQDVFIKLPQPNQVPKYCDKDRLEKEVVDVLRAMHSYNQQRPQGSPALRAWVWKRTWLWRDPGGFQAAQYDRYVTDMADIVRRAKRDGVAAPLEGIGIIETNLTNTDQVRDLSVRIARDVNAKTGGWLKSHTFLFPGAGMGSWWKGIDREMPAFYSAMKAQVKYFAFIYKFMPSHDRNPERVNDALEPFYYGPKGVWKTQNESRSYIEDTLGFADLRRAVEWGKKNGHGQVANILFWGDSGDGLIQMSRANVRLMHQLIVQEMGERGHFFDFAIVGKGDEKPNIEQKHLLVDRGAQGVTKNQATYDEWTRWSNPSTRH